MTKILSCTLLAIAFSAAYAGEMIMCENQEDFLSDKEVDIDGNKVTCAAVAAKLMPNGFTPSEEACNAMVTWEGEDPNKASYYLAYAGRGAGCCGSGMDSCAKYGPKPFQLCETPEDFQTDVLYEVKCSNVDECPGEWDEDEGNRKCKISVAHFTGDLKSACTEAGGTVEEANTCGMMTMHFSHYGLSGVPDEEMCKSKGGDSPYPVSFTTNYFGNQMGCCKGGSMSTPKDSCAKFAPEPFQTCANPEAWLPDHVFEIECTGLEEGKCMGEMEYDDGQQKCKISKRHSSDMEGACTGAGGRVVGRSTCSTMQMGFVHYGLSGVPDEQTCSKMLCQARMTVHQVVSYFSDTLGCCAEGSLMKPANTCAQYAKPPTYQLCNTEDDFQAGLPYSVVCSGVDKETCEGIAEAQGLDEQETAGKFDEEGAICKVEGLNAEAVCEKAGGSPSVESSCGMVTESIFPGMFASSEQCADPSDNYLAPIIAKRCCTSKKACCGDESCMATFEGKPVTDRKKMHEEHMDRFAKECKDHDHGDHDDKDHDDKEHGDKHDHEDHGDKKDEPGAPTPAPTSAPVTEAPAALKLTGQIGGSADKLPTKSQAQTAVANTLEIDKSRVKATVKEGRRLSSDDRRLATVKFTIDYEVEVTKDDEEALTTKVQKIATGGDAIQNKFADELAKGPDGVTVDKTTLTAPKPKKVSTPAQTDTTVSGSPPRFQMAALMGTAMSAALLAV